MRGLITRSPLEYPGRSAKLNWSHPATTGNALRLAAVAQPNNSLVDLLSGFVSTFTNGAGEQDSLGPTVYPSTGVSGGYTFPSPFGQEVLTKGVTLAVIFQPRTMTRGQGLINTNNDTTQGLNAVKINTTATSTLNYTVGGSSFAIGPATLIAGRNYAAFASVRPATAAPKEFFGVVDLVTGQKWFSTWTANTQTTTATNFSVATYIGGLVDNGRVAAAAIVARAMSPGEVTAWMDDPWSLWYDNSASNVLSLGVKTAGRPFGSQINFSVGAPAVVATIGLTGSQTASAAGTLSTGTNVAISGSASTSSAGAVQETAFVAISGAASASAAGTVTFGGLNVPIAGAASASSVGALKETATIAVSGAASVSAAGAVSFSSTGTNVAISGAASASTAGAVAVNETIVVLGAASASAVGSVTVHAGASTSVNITGVASSSGAGLVTEQVTVAISGVQSASAVGAVTTPISIPISGAASASAASASVVESIALSGAQSASAAGAVSERVTVALTGAASVTGASAGTSVQVNIVGAASSTASGTIKITAFLPIGGAASFSGAGTVTVTGPPIFVVKVPFGRSAIPLRPRIRRVSQNRI
jgi:hypothetical protein